MINKIINEWDPIDLFPYAPRDEYEEEIRILDKLVCQKEINEKVLAEEIYQVFTRRFGADFFIKSKTECAIIARKIINNLNP